MKNIPHSQIDSNSKEEESPNYFLTVDMFLESEGAPSSTRGRPQKRRRPKGRLQKYQLHNTKVVNIRTNIYHKGAIYEQIYTPKERYMNKYIPKIGAIYEQIYTQNRRNICLSL